MNTSSTMKIFSYCMTEDTKDKRKTNIKIFGLTEGEGKEKKTVCLHVSNFEPYVYLELPKNVDWTKPRIRLLLNSIKEIVGPSGGLSRVVMVRGKKLYNSTKENDYPFLKLFFQSMMYIRFFKKKVDERPVNILSLGTVILKVHEDDLWPLLQFTITFDIPFEGWIQFTGSKVIEKETYCDLEYNVDCTQQGCLKSVDCDVILKPVILSMDIEVYSSVPGTFPQAERSGDKVFQISGVVLNKKGQIEKYLLTLGQPDPVIVGEDVEIRMYDDEVDLLHGYVDLVNEVNPQVIIGYNIFGFDIQYMIDRSKLLYIADNFTKQSMIIGRQCKVNPIKWSSSAYGEQKLNYLDTDGRIHVDLLPIIRRNYNLDNYKLQTVSEKFLGQSKDPLDAKGIFRCYELFTPESLAICGKYNVQDSSLVLNLFDHLQLWFELVELGKTCNVPIIYTYTRGQQVRVFSQVCRECVKQGFIVNKSEYTQHASANEFVGATVFEPVHGIHENVVSFDFSSLYPSTQIAYNISYDTIITDSSMRDDECHVIEWNEHINCECENATVSDKGVKFCGTKRFRFRKDVMGVLPIILKNLLDARAKTRREMKDVKDKLLLQVLDKRQLAYKVSANSVYGSLGTGEGYLPFMPGAECTTAMGRKNILIASKFMQEQYKARILYGDTDSQYVMFPGVPLAELNAFCYKVQDEVSAVFPKPMKMAYEEKIMRYFLIFTKKRYIAQEYPKPGKTEGEIIKKGVILVRRDSCKIARQIFNDIITTVFKGGKQDSIKMLVLDMLNSIYCMKYPASYFKITKSVKDSSAYKIRELPEDPVKRFKRLKDLGCDDEQDYRFMALPPHVQLSEKLRMRGEPAGAGSRIEYVIIKVHKAVKSDDKLFRKIEELKYFTDHKEILRLDYQHYLEHMILNPISELLNVVGINPGFLEEQVKLRKQKILLCEEIKGLTTPEIQFD